MDDLKMHNMLHAALVVSSRPHAKILSVDASAATKVSCSYPACKQAACKNAHGGNGSSFHSCSMAFVAAYTSEAKVCLRTNAHWHL